MMIETLPKTFVFVLMPFAKEFDDIYKVGIKPACRDAGAYCERVDEQIFHESILERIYNQISRADLIVSDMTGRNPNVFYETGYAHALGKQVVLLTQNSDDIPFDLKHYPHIVYGGKIAALKDELERRVRWCVENPARLLSQVDLNLEFYMNGRKVSDGYVGTFDFSDVNNSQETIDLDLDIHNASEKICDASLIEIGVVMPREFEYGQNVSTARLSDKECMHILPALGRLLPNAWKPASFNQD
jgi:hypothetical protein